MGSGRPWPGSRDRLPGPKCPPKTCDLEYFWALALSWRPTACPKMCCKCFQNLRFELLLGSGRPWPGSGDWQLPQNVFQMLQTLTFWSTFELRTDLARIWRQRPFAGLGPPPLGSKSVGCLAFWRPRGTQIAAPGWERTLSISLLAGLRPPPLGSQSVGCLAFWRPRGHPNRSTRLGAHLEH